MSKGEELYIKKSRYSNPNMSDTEDPFWDDSSMTAAYDRALKKANVQIAKQIAMETNTKFKEIAKTNEKKGKAPIKPSKVKQWKEGMQCRAKYFEDGIDYEAVVTAILDENECVVRFVGFENSEVVPLSSLNVSRGEESRMRQIQRANADKYDDGFESQSNGDMSVDPSEKAVPISQPKGKKSSKKKSQKAKLPDLSGLGMPDFMKLNATLPGPNFRLPNVPIPPPPPVPLQMTDTEEQALSAMLVSWYMSGFHTGFYQGIKTVKENRRNQN